MQGSRTTQALAAAVSTVLVAGVVAATATAADEGHDGQAVPTATSTIIDEQVRTLLAQRASRSVGTSESSAAALAARALHAERAARAERRKARVAKQRERARERKVRERKRLQRERRALAPRAAAVRPGTARAIGRQMARKQGFTSWWQWNCLDALWTAESGWRTSASNSRTGAHGIPQAFPGSKMASHGSDWQHSARTQISWGLSYIDDRWGTPCNAYNHFKRTRWY